MAYPAVAVAHPHLVSPTEMPKDDFKREKLSLPKLSIKAGDATILTRTVNELVAEDHVSTQYMVFFRRATLAPSGEYCSPSPSTLDISCTFTQGFANWTPIYG